jgi:hypothetical protein
MEHLAAEYSGPATVILCSREVEATADLQSWRSEPAGVDGRGEVVYDLDPPTPPRWVGTITVSPPADASPIELPTDGQVVLRLANGCEGAAEVEVFEWTVEETLVLAVLGREGAPF